MKKFGLGILIVILVLGSFAAIAKAEDSEAGGVAGCQAVAVDPGYSLEMQQNICYAAEGDPATSCAASGHGVCSSPKLNDTLPEANHCVCIGEVDEAAPEAPVTEEMPVTEG